MREVQNKKSVEANTHTSHGELGMMTLFLATVVVYLLVFDVFSPSDTGSTYDNLRYIVLLLGIIYGYIRLIAHHKFPDFSFQNFGSEIGFIYITSIILFLFSIHKADAVLMSVGARTYVQIGLIIMPALYSYALVNVLSIKQIRKLFEITLLITIFFYVFVEVGFTNFFDLSNYSSISMANSESPFESSISSGTFFTVFLFLNYYRFIDDDKKTHSRHTFFFVLSFIFTLLSFKRLSFLFAILIIFINYFINLRRSIPRIVPIATAIFFTIATYYYTLLMKGDLQLGTFDIYQFSKGRSYILSLWQQYGYLSYGYGSSFEVMQRYLEMDLVQIYMEVGIICLFAFCFSYFLIIRNSLYAYIIMIYEFLNMLTASSIPGVLNWTFVLVTVICVSSEKDNEEGIIFRDNPHLYWTLSTSHYITYNGE